LDYFTPNTRVLLSSEMSTIIFQLQWSNIYDNFNFQQ
jgi:hypothetical protein